MLCKNIKLYNINRMLKLAVEKILISFFDNIKERKKNEILLKVIEKVYTKNLGMLKLIDKSMIDICKEEEVSPKEVFFCFFCCWLYRYRLSKQNSLCAKDSLWKF